MRFKPLTLTLRSCQWRSYSQSLALIAAVNQPQGQRFYCLRGASKPTNLDDLLPNLKENFPREMCNRLLAWFPGRVTDVILTGGAESSFGAIFSVCLKRLKSIQ